ncbi:carboxylesterase 1 [Cajanus cajan]|uniref:Gibberellin receptor GID1 n=1 Tax=Cajanus cajan TaxID=3821 RepID=A0A151RHF2_CAJCA|nr:carboxylesterase 1 [Cajanus cajan]KYP41980.1 Gibberellin receptor GID1 [Cajanus cajan]
MSNQSVDPYQHLGFLRNRDGTVTRLNDGVPRTEASSDPSLPIPVLTKDLTMNQRNNTWLRLFLPRIALSSPNKLPLIIFFHGSGFVVMSAATSMFHDFCVQMANITEAVVASVDYRLAPEHRLPAAYDDGVEALRWIRRSDEEWLTQYVDYSKCYLMGNSAGATLAYHAGLRATEEVNDLEPLKIQGLILRQPFFGGTQRSESELRLENNPVIPLCVTDLMWELALPIGADRDHEYCNPWSGNGVQKFDKLKELGWRVLVSGNGEDLLVDREIELAQLMEEKGVQVVKDFVEDGSHGVEIFYPSKANKFIALVKDFIYMIDA